MKEDLLPTAREFLKDAVIEPPIMKEAFVELMAKFAAAQTAHLVEENRKLRAALEHYADKCDDCDHLAGNHDGDCTICDCEKFSNIARAALEEADKTDDGSSD